jgi:hypothetical protein
LSKHLTSSLAHTMPDGGVSISAPMFNGDQSV